MNNKSYNKVRILTVLIALTVSCFVQPMTCLKSCLKRTVKHCRRQVKIATPTLQTLKDEKNLVRIKNRKVIYLSGAGSSGKSSIAKALIKMIDGPTEIVDSDQMIFEVIGKKIIEQHGGTHVSDAECCSYLAKLFEQGQAQDFLEDVRRQMDEKARYLYLNGKNVIIDDCMSNQQKLERFKKAYQDFSVLMVLVYCPIDQLFQHVIQRNQMDDEKEHRSLDGPFRGFFELHKNRTMEHEMQVDILKKSLVEKVFEQIQEEARRTIKDSKRLAQFLITVNERNNTTIAQLGLDKHNEVIITSRFAHDMMVNTGSLTSEQCARQIACALSNENH